MKIDINLLIVLMIIITALIFINTSLDIIERFVCIGYCC